MKQNSRLIFVSQIDQISKSKSRKVSIILHGDVLLVYLLLYTGLYCASFNIKIYYLSYRLAVWTSQYSHVKHFIGIFYFSELTRFQKNVLMKVNNQRIYYKMMSGANLKKRATRTVTLFLSENQSCYLFHELT